MSLRLKYSILLSFVVLVILSGFSAVIYVKFENRLNASAEQSLVSHLEHEWNHISSHGGEFSDEKSTLIAKNIFLRIWRDDRLIFDVSPPATSHAHIERQLARELNGHHYLLLGVYDLGPTLRSVAALRNILLLGCLLSVLLIGPISWFFTGALLQPFRKLSQKTSELTAERLDFRFPKPERLDEYGVLVNSFNSLLDRLNISFTQIKRFAANASHEFRTPLSVIQGEAQLLLRKPRDPAQYIAGLNTIVSHGKVLKKIINRLLFLADLERVEQENLRTEIRVGETIAGTLRALDGRREDAGVSVQVIASPGEVSFAGQQEVFVSIVNNLIENAIKYSRSEVSISYGKNGERFFFRVEDDGPGIPEAERENVFEALQRGDNRTRSGPEGHGLGLAIVLACVKAAKGTIVLDRSPLGGLAVVVELPTGTPARAESSESAAFPRGLPVVSYEEGARLQ